MAKITYLGHSSFLIESKDYQIVIDPYKDNSVPNLTFPRGLVVDKVFCSHSHFDHNAIELVKVKEKPNPVNVIRSIVPHDRDGGLKRGMNSIRMFDVDGFKVVHLGDTGCVPPEDEVIMFKDCDVLLAPINGFFTINPRELKEICKIINPRIVVPMHYYMKDKKSGYPDEDMFEEFQALFPDIEYLDKELDLEKYKDYKGALVFKNYLQ